MDGQQSEKREAIGWRLPGHPDTAVYYVPPTPAQLHQAHTGTVVLDDKSTVTVVWSEIVVRVDSIPNAEIRVKAVVGKPGSGWGRLVPTNGADGIAMADADVLLARGKATQQHIAGRRVKVTAETAPHCAEIIRTAFRRYVKEHRPTEPSQLSLVEFAGADIGYYSKRGLEAHLKQLRPYGYYWPDSFR